MRQSMRTETVMVWLTPGEQAEVERRADTHGLSVDAYVRAVALGGELAARVPAAPEPEPEPLW